MGIGLTAWRYMWRTTGVHRWESSGALPADAAPELPPDTDHQALQSPADGVGPLIRRIYRVRIVGSSMAPEDLVGRLTDDLDRVAPSEFATFQKLGKDGPLGLGDEYLVRMPGPWDGPVRVVAANRTAFRLATLDGHLEAGQIEFRASADHRSLVFEIESWARSGDRLADLLYSHLRLAKEVQMHMWTSVLEKVVTLSGGRSEGGITTVTRRVPDPQLAAAASQPVRSREQRRLASLANLDVNFDVSRVAQYTPENGWRRDDLLESLPGEPSGPPVEGGSWRVARRLMDEYQLADPGVVRAVYSEADPLEGRDMLLRIRFAGLRLYVGVRIGSVYEETRSVHGRRALVFGWYYDTLRGHFEEGRMHYELWKWLDSGDVEFRLHAFSRPARTGPLLLRVGFRLFGRTKQLRFYRQIARRAKRLTEAQIEAEATAARRAESALQP